jgi:hypothetical protein
MTKRSPQREALAQCIEQRDQAAKTTEDTRAALARAKQLHQEVDDQAYDLKRKMTSIRDADAAALEAAVRQNAPLPVSSLHQAKLQLAEAEDRLVAAKSAVTNLEASLKSYQLSLDQQNSKVSAAAKAVLASELPSDLVDGVRRLRDEFEAKVAALGWLVRFHVLQDYDPEANKPFLHHDAMQRQASPAVHLLREIGYNAIQTDWLKNLDVMDRSTSVQVWRSCLERLQKDPDATLPT